MPCVSPVPLVAAPPVLTVVEEPPAAAAEVVVTAGDSPVPPPMMVEMAEPELPVHCDSPTSTDTADADIPLDLVPDTLPVLFTSVPPAVSSEDLPASSGRERMAPTADAIAASKPLSPYAVRPSSVPRLVIGSSLVDRNALPDATVRTPTPGLLRLARTAKIYGAFLKPHASVGGTASSSTAASINDTTSAGTCSHTTAAHEVAASTPPATPVDTDLDTPPAQLELVDFDSD
jgi:hypothetical protein